LPPVPSVEVTRASEGQDAPEVYRHGWAKN
jgi:hypothetical protein